MVLLQPKHFSSTLLRYLTLFWTRLSKPFMDPHAQLHNRAKSSNIINLNLIGEQSLKQLYRLHAVLSLIVARGPRPNFGGIAIIHNIKM